MNFFQLEVFLKVVENGSFTRAGDQIGLTQSGVSHNITALETELGVNLLKRGRNGVSLTTAGEYIIPHIRAIVENMAHIEQKVAAVNGMEMGKLSIGSFPSFTAKFIPSLFSIYKEKFPNIEIRLYEGGYDEIIKWVEEGTVDFGFAALPVKSVKFIPLLNDPLSAVIYEGHHFENNSIINLEDFIGENFIMLRSGCETLIEEKFREAKIKPNISYDIKDNQTVLSMVAGKLGITIMPDLALSKELKDIRSLPLNPKIFREIGLVKKSAKELTPAATEFSKIVQDYFINR
ncbi:LysR family transcriptional regulator [Bacillus sp. L_1B0_8]|uniref:LysR family transcriptional regulator n=1 Tax=Bacillus TaxID=1386 RepID=UPI0005B708B4|nr:MULTISPECIES: LysR family transcriptional regulator [Bacillus]KIQ86400.1 LysR family transcriptional regulator [Bacillus sp. L_1B0_5]KIQ88610.1 LysR family transcriptional regulator [Bacillus sp. L_1B0_8]MED2805175.1 LysR family transcriptional regulator [Bacillus thuringiensis]PEM06096.1 LysR family transcriptional regulator [Bacillus cereus]PQQ50353.1 LysR family transcriptional regulator [Bacillus thuringiensis]